MSGGPGDPGLIQTLIQAGALGVLCTSIGGAVGWYFRRLDSHRAAEAIEDREEENNELEGRRFLDQRAVREIERLERERDDARTEARSCSLDREKLLREIMELREGWGDCRHEALRCQQLIISLHLHPPESGQAPPTLNPLPDPRQRPASL